MNEELAAWRRLREHMAAHVAVNKADGRNVSVAEELLADIDFIKPVPLNKRMGFYHIHSGEYECGMAYKDERVGWRPCSRLVNHGGNCGYEDNSAL